MATNGINDMMTNGVNSVTNEVNEPTLRSTNGIQFTVDTRTVRGSNRAGEEFDIKLYLFTITGGLGQNAIIRLTYDNLDEDQQKRFIDFIMSTCEEDLRTTIYDINNDEEYIQYLRNIVFSQYFNTPNEDSIFKLSFVTQIWENSNNEYTFKTNTGPLFTYTFNIKTSSGLNDEEVFATKLLKSITTNYEISNWEDEIFDHLVGTNNTRSDYAFTLSSKDHGTGVERVISSFQ